jgi:hypothetical protein
MKKYHKILLEYYGNHSAVAKVLGITAVHYRRIRNGHHKGSDALNKLIILKAGSVIGKEAA